MQNVIGFYFMQFYIFITALAVPVFVNDTHAYFLSNKQNSHQISLAAGMFVTALWAAQRIHAGRYYIPPPSQHNWESDIKNNGLMSFDRIMEVTKPQAIQMNNLYLFLQKRKMMCNDE